jgi:hypothetical protein
MSTSAIVAIAAVIVVVSILITVGAVLRLQYFKRRHLHAFRVEARPEMANARSMYVISPPFSPSFFSNRGVFRFLFPFSPFFFVLFGRGTGMTIRCSSSREPFLQRLRW